jgi:hypothetical protein
LCFRVGSLEAGSYSLETILRMPFRLEVWADYETEASMGVPISNVSGKASKILGLTVASPRARTGSGVSKCI